MQRFEKKVREIYTITMDYEGRLPADAHIDSASVLVLTNDTTETNVTSSMIIGTPLVVPPGYQVKFQVHSGTKNKEYQIRISANLSTGDLFGDNIIMTITPG